MKHTPATRADVLDAMRRQTEDYHKLSQRIAALENRLAEADPKTVLKSTLTTFMEE